MDAGELTETVYLIDDELRVLKALMRLLKSYGYVTKSFLSAQDFLAAYDPSIPGCILLDLRLADMDGLDLQLQREDRPCRPSRPAFPYPLCRLSLM